MRNYHSVKIENIDENADFTRFKAVGENVQSLEITHSTFRDIQSIREIFGSLRLLDNVKLVRVKVDCEIEDEPLNTSLTLKRLELVQVDHRLLNLLSNVQVISLEIIDANNRTDTESLVKFIAFQKKLNCLTIENLTEGSSMFDGMFDANESKNFKFKLKRLSTLFSHIRNIEKFEVNFISFLKPHVDSLRKVRVEGSLSPKVLKYMIAKLNIVEELEVNVNELPQESSFYDSLKQNRSLKTLRLNGTITRSNLYAFKGIISHYQNIRKISLADTDKFVSNDVFQLMSSRLTNLNHICLLNLHESFTPNVIFSALKHFSIRILNEVDQWKAFVTANDSIESLKVGWIKRDQFTSATISEITSLPKLMHLKFGGRFIASKRIYDVIKCDYKKIRVLEFMVANYDEIKNLRFIFPLDKSLWKPQCEYFDEGSDREPLND